MSLPNETMLTELTETELDQVHGGTEEPPATCETCTSGTDPVISTSLYEGALLG